MERDGGMTRRPSSRSRPGRADETGVPSARAVLFGAPDDGDTNEEFDDLITCATI